MRTGDLGVLVEGELFVTGRIKDLVVVAGRNHHPLDIERACERASAALRGGCGAAFSVERAGAERIAIVFEVVETADTRDTRDTMRAAVASATGGQVDAIALLAKGALPKTSSGKVQRHRCRPFLSVDADGVVALWQRASTDDAGRGRAAGS